MQEKELKVQGLSKQVLSIREGILENTETYKKDHAECLFGRGG